MVAQGSQLSMSFILHLSLIDPAEQEQHRIIYEKARAAGTPFLSFYRPEELLVIAKELGFRKADHVSRSELIARYFVGRTDGLEPSSGEEILIATV